MGALWRRGRRETVLEAGGWKAVAITQVGHGRGLDRGGRGGGARWSDSAYLFQIGPTGLTDGLDVRYERKRGIKKTPSLSARVGKRWICECHWLRQGRAWRGRSGAQFWVKNKLHLWVLKMK